MLNPERVDVVNPKERNSEVEIEFTDENAESVIIIKLDESAAMSLAHMIQDSCSYKAKIERGLYPKPRK